MAGITEKMYGNQGGGSGGDSHNKGHFATPEDLRTAFPTAEAGDYATVESTDTIWLWDSGTSAWVDGHKTDAVTSVNNKTGAVVLNASDVGALPTSGGTVSGPVTLSDTSSETKTMLTVGCGPDSSKYFKVVPSHQWSQVDVGIGNSLSLSITGEGLMPNVNNPNVELGSQFYPFKNIYGETVNTGRIKNGGVITVPQYVPGVMAVQLSTIPEAHESYVGQVYQYVGTTNANYTNGYFYKCVSDGQTPATYSWEQVDVQPSSGGAQYEYTAELEFTPNVDSEGAIIIELAADNVATLQIGQYVSYEYDGVWDDPVEDAVYTAFMQPSLDTNVGASKILWTSPANRLIWMDGYAGTGQNGQSVLNLQYQYTDSALEEDHCKIVLKIISDKELTIRATKDYGEFVLDTNAGIMSLPIPLYQESDQTRFYPVQQGGSMSWEPIPEVISLPSQTGMANRLLRTNGTNAYWWNPTYINNSAMNPGSVLDIGGNAYGSDYYAISIYAGSSCGSGAVSVGYGSHAAEQAVAIGRSAQAEKTRSIQLGTGTNNDANTMKVANANGNFEIMSADGTIPAARHAALPAADGTYTLQLVISNGVPTLSWVAV